MLQNGIYFHIRGSIIWAKLSLFCNSDNNKNIILFIDFIPKGAKNILNDCIYMKMLSI